MSIGVSTTKNQRVGNDIIVMVLSLIGLIICAIPLLSEHAFQYLTFRISKSTSTPVIGQVNSVRNDIRLKHSDSFSWNKLDEKEKIHSGDSVFTGAKSRTQIQLNNSNVIDLEENSMVNFTTIQDKNLPDLALGNFVVKANGKMKIAIQGRVAEIDGDNAEIQFSVKPNEKPKLKIAKGSAKIVTQNIKQTKLAPQSATSINITEEIQIEEEMFEPVAKVLEEKPVIKTADLMMVSMPPEIVHTVEFYDLYENNNGLLTLRSSPRHYVVQESPIGWSWTEGERSLVYTQLSNTANFETIAESFIVQPKLNSGVFKKAYVGENYYRVSTDGLKWRQTGHFNLKTEFLNVKAPELNLQSKNKAYLLDSSIEISLVPKKNTNFSRFLIEESEDKSFETQQTKVSWVGVSGVKRTYAAPKTFYSRIRGVNEKGQLSQASEVYQIEIVKPEMPKAPWLAQDHHQLYEDEYLNLKWQNEKSEYRTQMELFDSNGKKISSKLLNQSVSKINQLKKGQYEVRLYGVDSFSRKSKEFSKTTLLVEERPSIAEALKPEPKAEEKKEVRKVASESMSKTKLDDSMSVYINRDFEQSKLSLEGAGFTVFSTEQARQNVSNPTELTLGMRILKWFGRSGFEGSIKSKLASLSSASISDTSPTQVEARYHYRTRISYSPFSKYGSSQMSAILGYELYRNSGSRQIFTPQYDLLKTGLSLTFPMQYRWDTGGEFLYGMGIDQSKKYEISGFFSYYLKREWSFGFGYRVHLFEAGSLASSPVSLPYREAFGEGYSTFRWSY